jgi:hypothetical protein
LLQIYSSFIKAFLFEEIRKPLACDSFSAFEMDKKRSTNLSNLQQISPLLFLAKYGNLKRQTYC